MPRRVRDARHGELLASLAQLGARVQRELSPDAVHRRVRDGLLELGIRSAWLEPDAGSPRVRWVELGPGEDRQRLEALVGEPLEGLSRPETAAIAAVWRDGGASFDRWAAEVERWFGAPVAGELRRMGQGAYTRAIGVRIDVGGAPAAMLYAVGGWLRRGDLPAFQLFGSQIAAALEAARTVASLRERNADLDALNRIADAAANAPDFAAFLARAEDVLRDAVACNAVTVTLVDAERGVGVLVHDSRLDPRVREHVARMPLDHPLAVAVVREGRAVVTSADDAGPALGGAMRAAGVGTCVAVPLRIRSGVLGVLAVDFLGAPRDSAGCRLDLLQATAAHFAAAIESHRLLDDLRRRVAELTLLNDVAVESGALDPVVLLENAIPRVAATVRADVIGAYLSSGGKLVPVAVLGFERDVVEKAPGGISASLAQAAVRTRAPARSPDPEFDDARRRWFRERLGIEEFLAVPLLAKERAVGSLVLGRRERQRFDEGELRLLSAVGVQLGMAVENARLLADTQRRVADLEAVSSLALRVLTSHPGDTAEVLHAACREIAQALGAEAAVILRADGEGRRLVGVAAWGAPLPAPQISIDLQRTPIAADALRDQEPAWAPEVTLEPPPGAGPARSPPLSLLFVPLTSRSATRGLVAIADAPARRWGEAEVALAYALASEVAMAIETAELHAAEHRRVEELSRLADENARLYSDLRRSYADLARAQEQLIRQERLAALGQLSAIVAHEVRNPLGVIFNSLPTLRRLVRAEGDAKMLLDIVGEEADRLNRIVGDLLDFARPATPLLRPEPLDRVLDEAAAAAVADAGAGVLLELDVPADLPAVPMDARLMRQALLNVMANAVQAMPEGGTLRVVARPDVGAVRLEISDSGPGVPEEIRHRIFEPFFTTRPTGTGLGLAVVKRILDDHRASVEVAAAGTSGATFVIRLPLDPPPVENPPPLWSR